MRSVAPDAQLLAVTHTWGAYYTARAKAVLAGTWKTGNVWGGIKDGMVHVGDFGARVPAKVQAEVLAGQKAIASGKLHPFHATQAVKDNRGNVVITKGETLSDEKILGMNWLVEGVQGPLGQ
jgi:simple sugar transport system substrate-binding protein